MTTQTTATETSPISTQPHPTLPGVTLVLRDGKWIGRVTNAGVRGWTWGTYDTRGEAASYTDALDAVRRVGRA